MDDLDVDLLDTGSLLYLMMAAAGVSFDSAAHKSNRSSRIVFFILLVASLVLASTWPCSRVAMGLFFHFLSFESLESRSEELALSLPPTHSSFFIFSSLRCDYVVFISVEARAMLEQDGSNVF